MSKAAIRQAMFGVESAEYRFEHASTLFDAIAKLLESGQHQAAIGLSKLGHEIACESADDARELGGLIEKEGDNQ